MSNTSTNGDNMFNCATGLGYVSVDGVGGTDNLNIDYSSAKTRGSGQYSASVSGYANNGAGDQVSFGSMEKLNVKPGSGNDSYRVDDPTQQVALDSRASTDTFTAGFNSVASKHRR